MDAPDFLVKPTGDEAQTDELIRELLDLGGERVCTDRDLEGRTLRVMVWEPEH